MSVLILLSDLRKPSLTSTVHVYSYIVKFVPITQSGYTTPESIKVHCTLRSMRRSPSYKPNHPDAEQLSRKFFCHIL